MAEMPTDVTLGELWRGQQEIRHVVEELPSRLARELEAQAIGLRREITSAVERLESRVSAVESRASRIERWVTIVVLFVLGAVGAALLNLVIVHQP